MTSTPPYMSMRIPSIDKDSEDSSSKNFLSPYKLKETNYGPLALKRSFDLSILLAITSKVKRSFTSI